MYAGTVGAGRQVAQGEKRGADISSLLAERSMLEKTRRRLLAATELKKSGDPQSDSMFNGFFDVWNNLKNLTRGVVDALKDPSIYTFGYTDVNEASNLLGIKERLDRGEELTETEFHLAMSAALAHQGDQVAAPNLPNYINGYFYIASKSAVYN